MMKHVPRNGVSTTVSGTSYPTSPRSLGTITFSHSRPTRPCSHRCARGQRRPATSLRAQPHSSTTSSRVSPAGGVSIGSRDPGSRCGGNSHAHRPSREESGSSPIGASSPASASGSSSAGASSSASTSGAAAEGALETSACVGGRSGAPHAAVSASRTMAHRARLEPNPRSTRLIDAPWSRASMFVSAGGAGHRGAAACAADVDVVRARPRRSHPRRPRNRRSRKSSAHVDRRARASPRCGDRFPRAWIAPRGAAE